MNKKDMPYVLLIEDDTFLAEIYKTKFEMEKFKVSVARDGESGLQAIQKKKPDVVLLDVLLPQMDGFTVLESAKKDPRTAYIPIILLTNLGQKNDVDKGFQLGASEYLIKAHVHPSEVVDVVKRVLTH